MPTKPYYPIPKIHGQNMEHYLFKLMNQAIEAYILHAL